MLIVACGGSGSSLTNGREAIDRAYRADSDNSFSGSDPAHYIQSQQRSMEMAMAKNKSTATRLDIKGRLRDSMITLLNQQLADSADLYSQIKQAHWNVKGPHFIALHELFDKLAEDLEGPVDDIAERVTALGGVARGTARVAAQASRLPEFPVDRIDGLQAVALLADRYAALAASTRTAIEVAGKRGDADTSDLFTGISRGLDKALWFLEAHLG
jgi:starvation-inducible DNA-binding protein